MANVTFNNCTISIKQQVNPGATGTYNDYGGKDSYHSLPAVLATEKAMKLWKIAQDEGWVDMDFMPTISDAKASILADAIGSKLNLTERWKPFAELWGIKDLSKKLDKAMSATSTSDFLDLVTQKISKSAL